jgi:hypothetical protein
MLLWWWNICWCDFDECISADSDLTEHRASYRKAATPIIATWHDTTLNIKGETNIIVFVATLPS